MTHTVEKIGGTSMSRSRDLLDSLFPGGRDTAAICDRIFVVSAYGGVTNLLLEDKKTGSPGVRAPFANTDRDHAWAESLTAASDAMMDVHRAILDVLTRYAVRIVSKASNANTITHYLDAPLKSVRRVENDLARLYPGASIAVRNVAVVSAIGRDLTGLRVMLRGLQALDEGGIAPVGVQQTSRRVDVPFVVARDAMDKAVKLLHARLVDGAAKAVTPLAA